MTPRAFVYCPYCGTRLIERHAFDRKRPVCTRCGFVHFLDPKVAVIALIVWEGHVLLARRGVDPEKGKWALPGGYMDAGELPEAALRRELNEEVGIQVEHLQLLDVYPMIGSDAAGTPWVRGIVLAYEVKPVGERMEPVAAADDVWEARWFRAEELPTELAFDSTITLLTDWQKAQSTV